jgi:hypothetical protein
VTACAGRDAAAARRRQAADDEPESQVVLGDPHDLEKQVASLPTLRPIPLSSPSTALCRHSTVESHCDSTLGRGGGRSCPCGAAPLRSEVAGLPWVQREVLLERIRGRAAAEPHGRGGGRGQGGGGDVGGGMRGGGSGGGARDMGRRGEEGGGKGRVLRPRRAPLASLRGNE